MQIGLLRRVHNIRRNTRLRITDMPGSMNSLISKVRFSAQNMPISGDVGAETPRRGSQRLGRERERDRAFPNEAVSQTDIDSDYRLSETLPQTEQRNPAAPLRSALLRRHPQLLSQSIRVTLLFPRS